MLIMGDSSKRSPPLWYCDLILTVQYKIIYLNAMQIMHLLCKASRIWYSVSLNCAKNVFQRVCILNSGSHALFTRPTSMEFSKIFIKIGSHSIIHIFKNYFVTIFLVFSNKQYPNRPIINENFSMFENKRNANNAPPLLGL